MRNRLSEIKAKGFDMTQGSSVHDEIQPTNYLSSPIDFSKLKVGLRTLDDAVVSYGDMKKANPRLADKGAVLKAINDYDLPKLREISDYFFRTSGIYAGICRYMAFMYRYDWYVTPYIDDKNIKTDKVIDTFTKALNLLDDFHVKETLGSYALKVTRHGAFYGYKVDSNGIETIQELSPNYCRSRFKVGTKPAVEFNMKFFNDYFSDQTQRERVVKVYPEEIQKGYALYKAGKLVPDFAGDDSGWYLLDVNKTVYFNLNGEDYPPFISTIPLIIDLDSAQDLDRKKTMQRLLKIVIQKLPLDKNGDLIFDVDEGQQLHNNAVQMLCKAIGVDVLTTFADVEVASLSDTNAASAQTDDLERVERQLYNDAAVSKLLFNADGNIALSNSILTDNSTMSNLLYQFQDFLNELLVKFNKSNKVKYKAQLLTTTWYNYTELAKMYKEQMTVGFSKMLPQIALGQSQSSILSNAYFENDILCLSDVFIPPMQSSTMNADAVSAIKSRRGGSGEENGGGRPEKPEAEKSEKTLQNIEAKS